MFPLPDINISMPIKADPQFCDLHHFQVERDGDITLFNSTRKLSIYDAKDWVEFSGKAATVTDTATNKVVWPKTCAA